MLLSITIEIPGKFNEDSLSNFNICLNKGICEVKTLTTKTYNKLKNQYKPHGGPLEHYIIVV